MHAAKRSKTLTASMTAKITTEEETFFKSLAKEAGISSSEWCRRALIKAACCTPESRLILAELLALRRVFLTMQSDALLGQKPTEERIRQLVELSDRDKYSMADSRIEQFNAREIEKGCE